MKLTTFPIPRSQSTELIVSCLRQMILCTVSSRKSTLEGRLRKFLFRLLKKDASRYGPDILRFH